MSYSFWRPQHWRPGALAPLPYSYATALPQPTTLASYLENAICIFATSVESRRLRRCGMKIRTA